MKSLKDTVNPPGKLPVEITEQSGFFGPPHLSVSVASDGVSKRQFETVSVNAVNVRLVSRQEIKLLC